MKKDIKVESGLTVGVDLGDRWSKYCVLDEHGQILEEDTVATTGRDFKSEWKGRRINLYLIRCPFPFTRSTRSALQSEEYGHPRGHLNRQPRQVEISHRAFWPVLHIAAKHSSRHARNSSPWRRPDVR